MLFFEVTGHWMCVVLVLGRPHVFRLPFFGGVCCAAHVLLPAWPWGAVNGVLGVAVEQFVDFPLFFCQVFGPL